MNITQGYANFYGWTDVEPYEIVRVVSDKCIEIRAMKAERSSSWKPNWIPGGFSLVCLNNMEQQWIVSIDTEAPIIRARLHKDGKWYSKRGKHLLEYIPKKYYDFNF